MEAQVQLHDNYMITGWLRDMNPMFFMAGIAQEIMSIYSELGVAGIPGG